MAAAIPLVPRENMALTLADSFLNDLDELDEEEDGEKREEDDAEEELVAKVWSMDQSLRVKKEYAEHMESMRKGVELLIVESNEMLSRIDAELSLIHQFLVSAYRKRFPELETILGDDRDYVRVVDALRNDPTAPLSDDILPPSVTMVVSVTASTTSGTPLEERELDECLKACSEYFLLEKDKAEVLAHVESKMATLAPNLTALLNSSGLAAMLVGMAGGLSELARVPACNLTVMGQNRQQHLAGFGMVASMPHTGILFYCDLVQEAPAFLQRKALKMVAAKASLAARVDTFVKKNNSSSSSSSPIHSQGLAFRSEISSKLEKLQLPHKGRQVKALPVPDVTAGRKKRGGRRVRNAKERVRMTDMRALANKRAFGMDSTAEYGDDSMGLDLGLLNESEQGGSLRAPRVVERKNVTKKRKMVQMSSGATNGLSSSLVFTPVQGIELANPSSLNRVKAANDKWFSDTSGFQSALPPK